jgi:hypothetical protein
MICDVEYILCIKLHRELLHGINLMNYHTSVFFSMRFLDYAHQIIFSFECNTHLKFSEMINTISHFFL